MNGGHDRIMCAVPAACVCFARTTACHLLCHRSLAVHTFVRQVLPTEEEETAIAEFGGDKSKLAKPDAIVMALHQVAGTH